MNTLKRKITLVQIGGWMGMLLFFFWVFWGEAAGNPLWMALSILLVGTPAFYSHYFILKKFANRKSWGIYILGLLLLMALTPFAFLWVLNYERIYWPHQYLPFSILALLFIILSGLVLAGENWFLKALRKGEVEKQKMRAELSYLKSQINPHFLFNTLNNIHTLAYKGSADTPEAIMRLSSMMRYMLYESNEETVPLSREIEYLEDYISLQQLRLQNKSVVDFQIIGNINHCNIAPLLLIPLLENAYKHSPTDLDAGSIKITLEVQEDRFSFSVVNPVGKVRTNKIEDAGGIGLDNVQKRLKLLYPGGYKLNVNQEAEIFQVMLIIIQLDERKANLLHH